MIGDFNCDQTLWENSREAHKQTRSSFEVSESGGVWKRGLKIERVAQFETKDDAITTLTAAGYKQDGNTFRP